MLYQFVCVCERERLGCVAQDEIFVHFPFLQTENRIQGPLNGRTDLWITVPSSGRTWDNILCTIFRVLLCPLEDVLFWVRCFFLSSWIPFTHKEALDISIFFLHGNIRTLFCSCYY